MYNFEVEEFQFTQVYAFTPLDLTDSFSHF